MPGEKPAEPRHSLVELSEGVWAAIAGPTGDAISNSGVVGLDDGVALFDTNLTPRSARELSARVARTAGAPPTLVVNSHWHLDHVLGNSAFPKVPVWATRRTREITLELREQLAAEVERGALEKAIRDLESRRSTLTTEGAREDLEWWLRIQRGLLASADELTIVAADRTFETRAELPGARGAELRSFGSGHTEADAVLFLPDERVLFAGDLVVSGVQPSMGSGDPEHWLVVLDELERIGPEVIVPGHGPVLRTDLLGETRGYLKGVLRAAESREGASLPSAIERWEGSLSLEENLAFARRWLAARSSP